MTNFINAKSADITLEVTVENLSPDNGGVITPVWFGLHDGSFDTFEVGEAASSGVMYLAEDGIIGLEGTVPGVVEALIELGLNPADVPPQEQTIAGIFANSSAAANGGIQGLVDSPESPLGIAPGQTLSTTVNISRNNLANNRFFNYGAMFFPSNDAFVANDDAIELFDEYGNFIGQDIIITRDNVWDAGTEVNDEDPNNVPFDFDAVGDGIDENGTVQSHQGFQEPGTGGVLDFGDGVFANADFTDSDAPIGRIRINPVINGTDDSDVIFGSKNREKIRGYDGNDFILSRNDDDTVEGGAGRDLILGNLGDDYLLGEEGRDTIDGGRGNDIIDGGRRNDQVLGGRGNDIIDGGRGNDIIDGGRGNDQVLGGIGNDTVRGNNGQDDIIGGRGNDIIDGGAGADLILGESGDDIIDGGAGADIILGESGDDIIDGGTGADIIDAGEGRDSVFGGIGRDRIFGGSGDDSLSGGAWIDVLTGGLGNDSLHGNAGNDRLIGIDPSSISVDLGLGAGEIDTLIGGLGADTFVLGDENNVYYDDREILSRGEFDFAVIIDFDSSEDFIQLQGSADLYSLDLFTSELGTIDAELIFDPGITARGEVIATLQDVSSELALTDSAFIFV